jgi:hypothetical protein
MIQNRFCFRPLVWGGNTILLGPLERANLNHWTNRVGVSLPLT